MTHDAQMAVIERLRAYRRQLVVADANADKGSLERAADLVELYEDEDRLWQEELGPVVQKRRGRPIDPESFDRFAKWAADVTGLDRTRIHQLHAALGVADLFRDAVTGIQPIGEWSIRPLVAFRKKEGDDATITVWREACSDRGAAADQGEVKRAIADWRRKNPSPTTAPRATPLQRWYDEGLRLMKADPAGFADAFEHLERAGKAFTESEIREVA
jgi:hypothetical protein